MAINSLNSSSHGLSGLVSGMDTQSMVDSMLAGTQAKIDKAKASKTILGYKRQIYRDSMSSIRAFQQNYFKFSSKSTNNLLSSSFYNTMTAATTSKAFKVTANSGALLGKTSVNSIEQLAQAQKLRSLTEATDKVAGKLDLTKIKEGSTIQLELDGISKTITIPQKGADGKPITDQAEFITQLNNSIQHAFGNGITAAYDSNSSQITFTPSDKSREFKIIGNADAMDVFGMKTGISNKINTAMRISNINFKEPLAGSSYKFEINGVEISADASDSLDSVISKINSSNANVKVRYSAIDDKFSIESTVSGEGTEIKMSQSEGNLLTAMFGIGSGGAAVSNTQYSYSGMTGKVPGFSDKITDQKEIDTLIHNMNVNLDRRLDTVGASFMLNVDGKDIEIKVEAPADGKDYTIEDVIGAIDKNAELSAKGIKLSLDIKDVDGVKNFTGGVTLSSNDGVKVIAGAGMSFMGISGSNEKLLTSESAKTTTLAQMGMTNGLTVDIGGQKTVFDKGAKLSDVMAAMKTELENQSIAVAKKNNPALTAEQEKAIRDKISIQVLDAPPGSEGKIRLFGIDIPVDLTVTGDDKKLFGTDKLSLNSGMKPDGTTDEAKFKLDQIAAGQNAIVYINGEKVVRGNNEFTVNGMAFELKETFNTGYSQETTHNPSSYADIDVTRNTDQIFNGVVKFMEDYNKIVDNTWAMLKSKTTYKDYPPLTDKQKESMSDREVELWEKKSQEGLMRADETLTAVMDNMRQVLSRRPAGSKYSLEDMGISVGYDMEKGIGGKLEFNDKAGSGEKLKEMIAQEPEALEKLFSDNETGIMTELNKVLEATVTPGKGDKYNKLSLVDLAGSSTMPDTSSKLYLENRDIDKNLENLNRKYKAEYTRYWKQFNAMEQTIQQMNQQSSWLTQQLGG